MAALIRPNGQPRRVAPTIGITCHAFTEFYVRLFRMSAFLVFSTAPNRAAARKIARTVLNMRLAACAHLAPAGESHYGWKGRLERAREIMLTFKTSKKALPLLMRTLKKVHPYETPEILAVRVDCGDPAYLKWLISETGKKHPFITHPRP